MVEPAPPQQADETRGGPARHRLLRFTLGGADYAMRVEQVSRVVDCGAMRDVPGAARSVVGLAEWRGNVLTVLDLPYLLDHAREDGPPCLLCLASPLQQVALLLPSRVRMVEWQGAIEVESGPPERPARHPFEGRFDDGGRPVRVIDSRAVVRNANHDARQRS